MDELKKKAWVRSLFVQHEGRLLRYVTKFTTYEKASEIVQDSFIKLIKVEDPGTLEGSELAWLFRVCRNRALDHLKKEKPMSQLKPGEELPFESEAPEDKLERDHQRSKAAEIMEALTSTQKEVVRLKFQEELSYKEISEITGHSVNHVGVILHEALKKLRAKAQEQPSHQKVVDYE